MYLDSNRGVVLLLLDYSAAFDMIDLPLMIQKLEKKNGISIKATAVKWFTSNLPGRS